MSQIFLCVFDCLYIVCVYVIICCMSFIYVSMYVQHNLCVSVCVFVFGVLPLLERCVLPAGKSSRLPGGLCSGEPARDPPSPPRKRKHATSVLSFITRAYV